MIDKRDLKYSSISDYDSWFDQIDAKTNCSSLKGTSTTSSWMDFDGSIDEGSLSASFHNKSPYFYASNLAKEDLVDTQRSLNDKSVFTPLRKWNHSCKSTWTQEELVELWKMSIYFEPSCPYCKEAPSFIETYKQIVLKNIRTILVNSSLFLLVWIIFIGINKQLNSEIDRLKEEVHTWTNIYYYYGCHKGYMRSSNSEKCTELSNCMGFTAEKHNFYSKLAAGEFFEVGYCLYKVINKETVHKYVAIVMLVMAILAPYAQWQRLNGRREWKGVFYSIFVTLLTSSALSYLIVILNKFY